jgi:hypothetical protein
MKKLKSRKVAQPRRLVLRRESIAQLTRVQLDGVAGGDVGGGCSLQPQSCTHSYAAEAPCVTQ